MEFITVIHFLLQLGMVVGPVTGYFDQIAQVRRTGSSIGFSLDTCGVLLVSNIIRVFFWFGEKFDTVLLLQSILMILVQLILLYVCVEYRYPISPSPNRRWFWNWYRYRSYLVFLSILTGILGVFSLTLGRYHWAIATLGYLALGIESTVPMPQAWENFRRQSVEGFSPLILLMWFFGDTFKTFYFLYTASPLQFILCGIVQLSVDSLVVFQFILYDHKLREKLGLNAREPFRPQSYNALDDIL
ncbi:1955_t:CDS:2 [Paraglomus brasilianum]|uniref:1955_t:CDS:1 n=1 Tax=Paraglomus brasilianum TaxID=144538 RepID=A0A9N8WQK4_9GLOM|nr:1955_t:CDS:2 [Paraglomus brasilianum]